MHQTEVTRLFWSCEEEKVQMFVFRCREEKSKRYSGKVQIPEHRTLVLSYFPPLVWGQVLIKWRSRVHCQDVGHSFLQPGDRRFKWYDSFCNHKHKEKSHWSLVKSVWYSGTTLVINSKLGVCFVSAIFLLGGNTYFHLACYLKTRRRCAGLCVRWVEVSMTCTVVRLTAGEF